MRFVVYGIKLSSDRTFAYVGYTSKDPNARFEEHKSHAKRSLEKPEVYRENRRFYNWLKLHYLDNDLEIVVLEDCEDSFEYVCCAEKYWIAFLRDIGHDLMNHSIGGRGGVGYTHTDEAKRKIGDAGKLRVGWSHSEEAKAKMRLSHLGVSLTDECKDTMSDGRRKASNHNLWNVGHSDEAKEKMRLASTGRVQSEAEKEKRRAAMKGRPKISAHSRYHVPNDILVPQCVWCEDLVVNLRLDFSSLESIRKVHKNYGL